MKIANCINIVSCTYLPCDFVNLPKL